MLILGMAFFWSDFFAKEDLDNVLRRGPWFIGDQFLSIRPWEPFFKPSTANVSLIAVWIRLCVLPFELYETEVLKQIGESIGKVLRIDSHTAMEARGKYARLCIQIDINKPLVNTILIGQFEQAMTYEGIQSLCFSYGRLGHKVEACPYTIRKGKEKMGSEKMGSEETVVTPDGRDGTSRESHVGHSTTANKDSTEVREESQPDGQYGPWMVVSRRTNGRKGTRANFSTEGTGNSGRNSAAQPPPGNPGWRGTSPNSTAQTQSKSHTISMHGAGDHTRKAESVWTPKRNGVDHVGSFKLGPLANGLVAKGDGKVFTGFGPLARQQTQAQSHRNYPQSVKGKKSFARRIDSSPRTSSDETHTRKIPSAKPNFRPSFHDSSHNHETFPAFDSTFKFTAAPNGELEHQSGWSETPGDQQDIVVLPGAVENGEASTVQFGAVEIGQLTSVVTGEVITGEQARPRNRDGSVYEDLGLDGMESEEGNGVPPSV